MQYKKKYLHMTHWCNSELTMTAVWRKWVKCVSETHKASFRLGLIQLQLVWRQKSEQEPVKDSKELVLGIWNRSGFTPDQSVTGMMALNKNNLQKYKTDTPISGIATI